MPWTWWKKKPARAGATITPKGSSKASSDVNLGDLAPSAAHLLSHLCVVQSALAGRLGQLAEEAWSSKDADDLMLASAAASDRYRRLRDLVQDYDREVHGALATPRESLHRHLERLESSRWYENVTTVYVLGGFTRDFFLAVAAGLPSAAREALSSTMADYTEEEWVFQVLSHVVAHNERALARMSLWSRRLVGDIMLICRDALAGGESPAQVSITLEPVFEDVIAAHTARLERLGLAA